MKISRGIVSLYDEAGNILSRRQYGKYTAGDSINWILHHRTKTLKRRGKIVAYYQIDPHSNPNKVRDNGRNLYQ